SDPARALGVELAILAQGSFGAREMGYASDADVQFIAVDRGAGSATVEITNAVATQIQKILNAPTARSDMKVSADLRPEGRWVRSPAPSTPGSTTSAGTPRPGRSRPCCVPGRSSPRRPSARGSSRRWTGTAIPSAASTTPPAGRSPG